MREDICTLRLYDRASRITVLYHDANVPEFESGSYLKRHHSTKLHISVSFSPITEVICQPPQQQSIDLKASANRPNNGHTLSSRSSRRAHHLVQAASSRVNHSSHCPFSSLYRLRPYRTGLTPPYRGPASCLSPLSKAAEKPKHISSQSRSRRGLGADQRRRIGWVVDITW